MKKTIYLHYDGGNIKLKPDQYFVIRDTLYCDFFGNNDKSMVTKKIALDKIQNIQYEEYDATKTYVVGGIAVVIVGVIAIIALSSFSFSPFN